MSYFFAGDGFDHYWILAPGAVPSGNSALTILGLFRPTANVSGPLRATKAGVGSWSIHADNPGKWFCDNDFSSGFTFSLNNWQMIGLTLPAGGAGTVRWDGNFASGGVYGGWTSLPGPTIPAGAGPIDALTFGLAYGRMVGNIAAGAVFPALSSAAIAAIGTSSGNAWMAASPLAYWQCNTNPALGITDQTGNGANSISLSGTAPTLDTVNEPPGWTYYTPGPSVTPIKGAFLPFLTP